MNLPDQPEHRRAFYLISAFLFGAALLRTLLIYWNRVELLRGVGPLLGWLIIFASLPILSQKWRGYFPLYLVLQTAIAIFLFFLPVYPDYFAVLFAILSMQIMQIYSVKTGAVLIALFIPITAVLILPSVGPFQSAALVLVYTSANILLASYAWNVRRAQEAHERNRELMQELVLANRRLQEYASQMEQLAVARERSNLARDLHDSVTQTIFSMTLTTQAALMLIDRDFGRVKPQLDRLNQLGQNALAELQVLISELNPQNGPVEGLAAAIRRHLKTGGLPESLSVQLEIEGEQGLDPAETRNLFRIVQEALNNVVKHSQAAQATIRLHLQPPQWIEVEDQGVGFDLQQVQNSARIGLGSMRERAVEIGWELKTCTAPGAGTRIRVEKTAKGASR